MTKRHCKLSLEKKRPADATKKQISGFWAQLPKLIVEARAGLIPSDETDACPPPEHLAAADLLRWYRGLPVFCKSIA